MWSWSPLSVDPEETLLRRFHLSDAALFLIHCPSKEQKVALPLALIEKSQVPVESLLPPEAFKPGLHCPHCFQHASLPRFPRTSPNLGELNSLSSARLRNPSTIFPKKHRSQACHTASHSRVPISVLLFFSFAGINID